jgi:hypothetical protein
VVSPRLLNGRARGVVEAVATRLLAWQPSGSLLLPVDCSPVSAEVKSRFEPVQRRVLFDARGGSYGVFVSDSHSELTTTFGRCNLQLPIRAIYSEQARWLFAI